jgi:hypothetical protein
MERADEKHPFFATDEAGRLRSQWQQIQESFVDDPRAAAQKADALVASVIQRLSEVFARERGRLEGEWSRGGEVTTEDLRVALQRYRAFFDRLLSVSTGLESATAAAPGASTLRPGQHGATAAGGAAAGAAIGSAAGAPGTAAGLAAGVVAGGVAGKAAGEVVDAKREDEYWRRSYATRPYVRKGVEYETYRPAYQYGWESYARYPGRRFEEVEPTLRRDWEGHGRSGWDKVRDAVRDAWHRVERAIPGDADRDGR